VVFGERGEAKIKRDGTMEWRRELIELVEGQVSVKVCNFD
jgi:hypothetical protein